MTNDRYRTLFNDLKQKVTPEENAMGWHFCSEYDGLLVGPTMSEWHTCTCWEHILKLQCEKRCEAAGWTLAKEEAPCEGFIPEVWNEEETEIEHTL